MIHLGVFRSARCFFASQGASWRIFLDFRTIHERHSPSWGPRSSKFRAWPTSLSAKSTRQLHRLFVSAYWRRSLTAFRQLRPRLSVHVSLRPAACQPHSWTPQTSVALHQWTSVCTAFLTFFWRFHISTSISRPGDKHEMQRWNCKWIWEVPFRSQFWFSRWSSYFWATKLLHYKRPEP